MDKQRLIINGLNRLSGEIAVHGAKNSALPILSAAVLVSEGEITLHNCPRLTDIDAALRILGHLGAICKRDGSTVTINATGICRCEIPQQLMREMRSSIIFLGAMIGRTGCCKLSFPGGCEIGPRPIDLHLSAFREMGIVINESHGYLECSTPCKVKGARITLAFPSVGATENIMLAAVTAKGRTEIHGAAKEPEICDLAAFLTGCGAKIKGAGTDTIYIDGVERLSACEHSVIPDRIVTVTYLCCAASAGGEIVLHGAESSHIGSVIPVLEAMGCRIYNFGNKSLYLSSKKRLTSDIMISTMPYPGFPTDAQAILMALCTTAKGNAIFAENMFDNRYRHASELCRMGAKIRTIGKVAVVEGVERLSGADVIATDLRGGAALVVAALGTEGKTKISEIHHIDRGYEAIEKVLRSVGADIKREI